MAVLYVTSLETGAGKTTICAGMGKHLLGNGKKVGFFKPIIAQNLPAEGIDSDVVFLKRILALEEPVDSLCPVISDQSDLTSTVKEAHARVSRGKDVVIVEGISEHSQASQRIVEALNAKVIIVADYSRKLSETRCINRGKDFGEYLLGVVLNKVPRNQVKNVQSEISPQFGEAGINILGVLPEDRILFTLTVGELAEHLQGDILNCADKSAELVENFMVGAMSIDPGPEYFGRKGNKAVVIRGERPDMQLAALETSTKCLILSGDMPPSPDVRHRAEDRNIPIVAVKGDATTIVMSIEEALDKARFNQEKKLPRLTEIMEQHFNFPALYQGLVLTS